MIDFYEVGEKISYYRKKLRMTQDDLACKLFVTRQALSKWENGSAIPSIETLLSLCQIFEISFEEILCLNENKKISVDINDIFKGHDRGYVIYKLINNEIDVDISDIFYQLSPNERMIVLKAIRDKNVEINLNDLWVKLTVGEQKFLGGK